MPKILVNHRRDDSAAYAGRLADRLREHFADDSVFVDIDAIPAVRRRVWILRPAAAVVVAPSTRWRRGRAGAAGQVLEPGKTGS